MLSMGCRSVGHTAPARRQDKKPLFVLSILKVGVAFQLTEVLAESNVLFVVQPLLGEKEHMMFKEEAFDFLDTLWAK